MRIAGIISGATAVLLVLSAPAALAGAGPLWNAHRSAAVCKAPHDQEHPAVSRYGRDLLVVWQDSRPDGKAAGTKYPLSVRGLELRQQHRFTVFAPPDSNAAVPAISGRHVVMTHNRGWSNAVVVTLPPAKPTNIGGTAFNPVIDGRLVVYTSAVHRWEGWSEPGAPPTSWITDILAYEVDGIGLPFDVCNSETFNQNNPDVSGTTVVWQQSSAAAGWANCGIYKRDIDLDPVPVRICKNPGTSAQNPAISGRVIVWQDNRNGDWDIYGYNLESGQELEICRAPGDQTAPAIDGPTVVWQDNRNGNWDLFGTMLSSGQVVAVYEGRGDQTEPDVAGDLVVWTDTRNGNKDIYLNRRLVSAKSE